MNIYSGRVNVIASKLKNLCKYGSNSDIRGKAKLYLFELKWGITMLSDGTASEITMTKMLNEMETFIKKARNRSVKLIQ